MTRRLVPALQVTLGVVDCCGHQYPIVLRVASLERVVVGYRKSFWLLVSVAELVAEQYGVTEGDLPEVSELLLPEVSELLCIAQRLCIGLVRRVSIRGYKSCTRL
jgi:hypothetical protein